MKNIKQNFYLTASLLLIFTTVTFASDKTTMQSDIQWNKIKSQSINLFYPGQSSWEWLLTKHSAAKSVRKGTPCLECHEDEENDMGSVIVKGEKLEPFPIHGKPGAVKISLKSAYDDERVYFQLQWQDTEFLHEKNNHAEEKHRIKITLMFGDKGVKEFPVAGCWGVCHDDSSNMKSHKGKNERHLYTSASRVKIKRTGGGDNFIDEDDIKELKEQKKFLEYWQLRITKNNEITHSHGYILEKRHELKQPVFTATAMKNKEIWTAEFSRKRKVSDRKFKHDVIALEENRAYNIGIALHDGYVSGRKHYVGFGRTFSLGGRNSQISASKQ